MRNFVPKTSRMKHLLRIAAVVAVFVAALMIQSSMVGGAAGQMEQAPGLWRAMAMQEILVPDLQMRLALFTDRLQESRGMEFIRPLQPGTLYNNALGAYERIVLAPGRRNPYASYRAGVMYGLDGFPGHAQDMLVQAAQEDGPNGAMYLAVARLFTGGKSLQEVLPQLREQPKWLQDLTIPYYYQVTDQPEAAQRAATQAREHQIAFGLWFLILTLVVMALVAVGIFVVVRFFWMGIVGEKEEDRRSRATMPVAVPWSVLDALEALALLTVLVIGLGTAGQFASRALAEYTDDPALQAAVMAVQYILAIGAALAVAASRTRARRRFSAMGLRTSGRTRGMLFAGVAGYSVLLTGALFLTAPLESIALPPFAQVGMQLMGEHTTASIIIYLLLLAVVAPIAEELLFRGYLYPALREQMSKYAAVPISAMLFALLHMNPMAVLPISIIGIVLAVLYETNRSVVPCIVCHALNNLMVFCVLMLAQI